MKKKILKRAGLAFAALLAAAAAWALYVDVSGIPTYEAHVPELRVDVTPARVERGKAFVTMLCAECHQDPATGRLTGKRLVELPPEFGEIWSKNITRHPDKGIGGWTDGELSYLLRTGLRKNGQYVPPYMPKLPHISDEDLASIIAFLKSDDPLVAPSDVSPAGTTKPSFLVKALSHTMFGPFPYPTEPKIAPPRTDRVAYGRYMAFSLDCYTCHSADFKSVDYLDPERSPGFFGGGNLVMDAKGEPIRTANLTPDDETGIGRWTEADFVRALKKGFRPDGRVLHYPMTPRPELGDDEAAAIYAYLRTVPKIHNPISRTVDPPVTGEPGKKLYVSYGCVSCHGDTGVGLGGMADLRGANQKYPGDDELRAWIDDAPSLKPGTRMPAWKGVIREEDYPPLLAYVRVLAKADGRSASR